MSYAIIGFGKIGHALAKAFARNGIAVSVATTRDPARILRSSTDESRCDQIREILRKESGEMR